MNTRCEHIYRLVLQGDTSSRTSLFDLAQCFIEGFDPQKLRQMLTSTDVGVVVDGLFVLGEIGDLARNYAPDILALQNNQDDDVRKEATRLAAIYCSNSEPQ